MTSSTAFVEPSVPYFHEIVGAVGHLEYAKSFWSNGVDPVAVVIAHKTFDRRLDLGRFSPKIFSVGIFDIL